MTCKKLRNKLSAYLDGELKNREKRKVQSHLRQCQVCREQLGQLQKIAILMQNLPSQKAPTDLEARILKKTILDQGKLEKKLIDVRVLWQIFRPGLQKAFVGAAVLVVIVGCCLYLWNFSSPPEIPINYFEKEYVHSQGMSPFSGELTMLTSLEGE